jgi:hypothetical protein
MHAGHACAHAFRGAPSRTWLYKTESEPETTLTCPRTAELGQTTRPARQDRLPPASLGARRSSPARPPQRQPRPRALPKRPRTSRRATSHPDRGPQDRPPLLPHPHRRRGGLTPRPTDVSTGPTERIRLAASSRLSLPPTPADARYGMSRRESPNQTSCADTTRADIGQGHPAHPSRPLGRPPPRTRASPSITGPLHIGTTSCSRAIGDLSDCKRSQGASPCTGQDAGLMATSTTNRVQTVFTNGERRG